MLNAIIAMFGTLVNILVFAIGFIFTAVGIKLMLSSGGALI